MAKANYILSAFADEASASFPEQLEALREAGIDRIEIRGVDGTNVSALTDEKAREVRRMLDGAGVGISAIGSPFGKIVVNEGFAEHLEALKRSMEQAKILGANTFRMFSFYPPKGEDIAAYRQQVIDQLGAMLDAADAQDIVLAHENENGIYGDIPERCLDLAETLGISKRTVEDLLRQLRDRGHIQMEVERDPDSQEAGYREGEANRWIKYGLASSAWATWAAATPKPSPAARCRTWFLRQSRISTPSAASGPRKRIRT